MAYDGLPTRRYRISDEDIRRVETWPHNDWNLEGHFPTPEKAVAYLARLKVEGQDVDIPLGLIESALRGLRFQAWQIARDIADVEAARADMQSND